MNDDLLNDFLEESYDLIEKVKTALSSWDPSVENKEGLNSIYRWVHTIKGGASVFSYKETTHLAHELESFLGTIRKEGDRINEAELKRIRKEITQIESSLRGEAVVETHEEIKGPAPTEPQFKTSYFEDFVASSGGLVQDLVKDGFQFFELLLPAGKAQKINEKLLQHEINSFYTQEIEGKTAGLYFIKGDSQAMKVAEEIIPHFNGSWCTIRQENSKSPEVSPEAPTVDHLKHPPQHQGNVPQEILRVPLSTVNSILDHVWELFLVRNQMSHFFKANKELFKDNYAFVQQFESFDNVLERNIHELESKTMSMRLSPIKKIFDRMEKVISEYCHQSGKKIYFKTQGEGIDLDKKVLDQLNEPLIHLIRNAIDHGIEDNSERVKKGKPETGSVELSAQLQGNEVLITVKDDGKGIDPKKILMSAKKKNIPVDHLKSENEILNLIFAPGFSTAEKVTDVSGRGVGMDAVKTSINDLGGNVSLETEVGTGTVFKIGLPLTMSVSKSLIVNIRGLEYAIPTKSVVFVEKVSVHSLKRNGNDFFYEFNEKLVPCFDLKDILPDYRPEPDLPETHTHVCVTSIHGKEVAFRVDEIIQTLNLVLKPLPKVSRKHPFLAGVSIMPGGNPVFVLNINECILNVSERRWEHAKRIA